MSMIYDYDLKKYKQIEFLRQNLYPTLEKALDKLIDHIIQSNEVQNHQERLKQQRIQDKLEQKRIEKEKLRQELGSDYESSGDENIFDEMEPFEEGAEQKSLSQQFAKDIPDQNEIIEKVAEDGSHLAQIAEEKEEVFEESPPKRRGKSATTTLLRNAYEPLDHLAKLLRELNQNK